MLRCVGVQRFRILALETRDPYPIAHVRLFTDETSEHREPEFDEVLA
jgi:Lon protease-like protein